MKKYEHETRRIDKPWGYELIWADTPHYLGKSLYILGGESLSLHYHKLKDEVLYLHFGTMKLTIDGETETITEGRSFRIVPNTTHRMEAVTDCVILEASTAHPDDSIRIEDRYGRKTFS